MGYIQPKTDFKDGDILYGIDLNASNEVIKAGVDDNFDRIQGLEDSKQDTIDSSNKLDYSLISNTPDIPDKTSDLTNDSGFIDNTYHDNTKQDVLTAGEGIQIENNVISNTQTSAEWGNIQGAIGDQVDLIGLLEDKQDKLISGTNIKTINNQSILGSGNISVGGGSGGTSDYDELDNRPQINSVTLTGNKSLSDLGINIPTKISDLTNDNNTVTDASYVHTDNNYTSAEKTKLSNIESGAEVNDIDTIKVNGTSQTITNKAVDITVPTKLSDLTNDNNTVTDASYVHTDNNYTSTEKSKLAGIEAGAQVNVDEVLVGDVSSATEDTKLVIEDIDLDGQYTESDYYLTEETLTNKVWMGKPVYRKVVNGTIPNLYPGSSATADGNVAHNISNLGEVVSISGKLIYSNVPYYLPILASSGKITCIKTVDSTNVVLRSSESWGFGTPIEFIIEYTKGGNS